PHEDTAWQRFLPGGPLAVLPFADDSCSIVWSLPADEAERVLALDDAGFGHELTRAFDRRLGAMTPVSPRATFPLRRQLASDCMRGRVLVLGDAAHVVHPLAGQGVNLGLRDVAALTEVVGGARRSGGDWSDPARLRRWARTRRSEAAVAAHAFEAIHDAYTADNVAAALLRGPLLGLAGRLAPGTHGLCRRASGRERSAHRLAARRHLERIDPVLHLLAAQAPVVVQVHDVEFAHEVGVAAGFRAHDHAVAVGAHRREVDAVVRRDRI